MDQRSLHHGNTTETKMLYTIKTLQQKTFQIEAEPTETIAQIKAKIEASQSFSVASQKLIHSGKILDDALPIGTYNLTEKDFIVVMVTKPKAAPTTVKATPVPVAATHSTSAPAPTTSITSSTPAASAALPTSAAFTASSLATGPEYEVATQNLCDMGFDREQVKAAMRAAFNNPDRAAEYLMTGIPETSHQLTGAPVLHSSTAPVSERHSVPSANLFEQAAQAAGPRAGTTAPATTPIGQDFENAEGQLDFLRNSAQFQELRQLVQTQPHLIQPLLQQIGQSNPEILGMINENREAFMQMLTEGAEGGEGIEGEGNTQYIQVTPEENEAILRLVSLGFDRSIAVEAYFACDKNEELAANYLFDNGMQGDDQWQ